LKKYIEIPNPCAQSWQEMTPDGNGRYCGTCAKTVVDFGAMTTDDIITHLSLNQKVCGRFKRSQLQMLNTQLSKPTQFVLSGWKRWSLALGLLTSFGHFKANAQAKQATIQTQDKSNRGKENSTSSDDSLVTLTGKIVDEQNYPLSMSHIGTQDNKFKAVTDTNGLFTILVPKSTDYLMVSSIGFLQKVIIVDNTKAAQETAVMKSDTWMGEVMINLPKISLYEKYIKWLKGERSY